MFPSNTPGSPGARKLRNVRFAARYLNVPVWVKYSSAPSVETNAPPAAARIITAAYGGTILRIRRM